MSIARKLFLGFLGTILLTAVIAGLALFHVRELKHDAERAERGRRNGLKLREVQLSILAQTAAARDYLRDRQPGALTAFFTQASLACLSVDRLRMTPSDALDVDHLRRLARQHEQFTSAWRATLEEVEAKEPDGSALRKALLELGEDAQELLTMTDAIIDGYDDRVRTELRMVEEDARIAYQYLWGDTVLALVVCAIIAYAISRQITRPLRQLVDATMKVGEGDLTHRAPVASSDEVGQLSEAFNSMVEQLQRSRAEVQEYSRSLEQKVAERTSELQRSEERYRSLMENAGDAILIIEPQTGAFLEVNRNACALTGYPREALLSMRSADVLPEPPGPDSDGGDFLQGETIQRREGALVTVDIRTNEIQYGGERVLCSIVRDVTEQHELERQIVQADKMASLGQLAGGVAHELNNPLGGILMNANLLMETLAPESEGYADLKRIEEDAVRCERIIKNLLDFSRQSAVTRKEVCVNDVVQRTIALLQHEADLRGVQVDCTYNDTVPIVEADPTQVQQVLVNIVINALHAMESGGQVQVSTFGDEGAAVIRIADDGPGFPAEIREKIFDPFFTTKDTGTGLGLSICYGIIEKHGGSIRVSSLTAAEIDAAGRREQPGTTFEVRLPTMSHHSS